MRKLIPCPVCHSELEVELEEYHDDNGNLVLSPLLEVTDSTTNLIQKTFLLFCRWKAEGEPEFGKVQWYYDPYHRAVTYEGDETYRFRIQTSDSPSGDTWMSGKFRVGSLKIELLEKPEFGRY